VTEGISSLEFEEVPIARVSDGDYSDVARTIIDASIGRCWCTVFIVDHAVDVDPTVRVDSLLMALASAQWRGVDARLLIGGSRTNERILEATLMARARAIELGIDTHVAASQGREDIHAKLVICDDRLLIGSHDWSLGMFGGQTQDSVLLEHAPLAVWLCEYFETQWLLAGAGDVDVSI
jgi:hypothetical protein